MAVLEGFLDEEAEEEMVCAGVGQADARRCHDRSGHAPPPAAVAVASAADAEAMAD